MRLSIGYSPCPNDCFVFYALAHGLVEGIQEDVVWDVRLEDVETLNVWAQQGILDLSKVSYHAAFTVLDQYALLRSGGALGRGVGPLVVTRRRLDSLKGRRVAIPGGLTTANLLLRLWQPEGFEPVVLRYDRIMPAVADGSADAGLIIHESRFTFGDYALKQHIDLGEWWESTTGLPLPLGGIMARRTLSPHLLSSLDPLIRASLEFAWADPGATASYVATHAQEMSPDVRQAHIELYVNEFTRDLGLEGEAAVQELLERSIAAGLVAPPQQALFVPR